MARKPQVSYWKTRNGFYVRHHGKSIRLCDGPDDRPAGPQFLLAVDTYRQMLELGNVPTAKDGNPVRAIAETFLVAIAAKKAPNTVRIRKADLTPFIESYGLRRVGSLSYDDLDAFITAQRQPRSLAHLGRPDTRWGDGAIRSFLKSITACFNWAVKRGHITVNPFKGYEQPAARRRGPRCVLPPGMHERILGAVKDKAFRAIIVALENTGARPGELINANKADWDADQGAIIYHGDDTRREDEFRHKTAGENRDRVIRFSGAALDMVRELVARPGAGPIFRGTRGARWRHAVLNGRFRRLRAVVDMPELIPTSYRHTFATMWLQSGAPIEWLAQILGNSANTIRKYYSHIGPNDDAVRNAFHAFRNGK